MKSKSRNVNRYVLAVQTRRALDHAVQGARVEMDKALFALTGHQKAEAERMLLDRGVLDQDFTVEVKVRRVRKAVAA